LRSEELNSVCLGGLVSLPSNLSSAACRLGDLSLFLSLLSSPLGFGSSSLLSILLFLSFCFSSSGLVSHSLNSSFNFSKSLSFSTQSALTFLVSFNQAANLASLGFKPISIHSRAVS